MTIWLPIVLPLLGSGLILALRRRRGLVGPVALTAIAAAVIAALATALSESSTTWSWGGGIELGLSVVDAGRIMVVLVPVVALAVVAYAVSSMSEDRALARLLALLTGFVAAMELLVMAADLLTLLIGWELVGAASWALIGHDWENPGSSSSAKEAFVATRFGDLGLYIAAGAAFAATGGFGYEALASTSDRAWLGVVAGGVIVAAAAKSAQLPFSPWLFSAMAGPTPVSALLHSATMVAAGAYALIRLQPALSAVPWFGPVVVALGLVTALAGGLVAYAQTDFKKALAGSTSAQYGLMLLATGAGFTAAGMGQLTAHAFFKALLFLGAGVALHATGTLDLGKLALGRALPRVAVLFGVGAAALAAVPPLGAAFTKEAVLAAAVDSGMWVGIGAVVAGVLSALYASRLHLLGYGPGDRTGSEQGPRVLEIAALSLLALLTLGLGLLWAPGGEEILQELTGGDLAEGKPWELAVSLGGIVTAFAFTWMLWRRGSLLSGGFPERMRRFVAGWYGIPSAAKHLVVDPILNLSRAASKGDRSIVDRMVGTVAASATWLSDGLRRGMETWIDSVAMAFGGGTLRTAEASREVDETGVDGVLVEGLAAAIAYGGEQSRRTQTGMSHHYYTVIVIGGLVAIILALIWR
ncbi:MAG: proton-conducting transporter membrane subunit [Acidimicrobiia bacterium]